MLQSAKVLLTVSRASAEHASRREKICKPRVRRRTGFSAATRHSRAVSETTLAVYTRDW